jgi:ATP-dependent Clp protease ATP-binding subunit ClpC
MYERFTDYARKVCRLARDEAHRLSHNTVDAEHILLGLLEAGRRGGLIVLERLGATPPLIHAELDKIVHHGPGTVGEGKPPWGPGGQRVLVFAVEESRGLGHPYVGTEHLLLGLLREEGGVAARVLTSLGIEPDRARKELIALMSSSIPPAPQPPPIL